MTGTQRTEAQSVDAPELPLARWLSRFQNPRSKALIGYWTTAFGCAGKLLRGVGEGAMLRDEARCVEVAQIAAVERETMSVHAEIRGPFQDADEGASRVGDAPRISPAVLAFADAAESESVAKRHP